MTFIKQGNHYYRTILHEALFNNNSTLNTNYWTYFLKYSQHTDIEVRLHVFIKAKQNRNKLQFLSSDTYSMQTSYLYIHVYTRDLSIVS